MAAKNLEDIGQAVVSVMDLAEMLELTDRRIQQMTKEGYIPKAGRGSYPLVKSVQGYLRWYRSQTRQPNQHEKIESQGSADLEEARLRNIDADTRLKELKEEELRGNLAPFFLLSDILQKFAAEAVSIAEPLPGRLKAVQPELSAESIRVIDAELVKLLAAIAKIPEGLDID